MRSGNVSAGPLRDYTRNHGSMTNADPEPDCEAKYDAEVELHKRKSIKFTVIRPGGLTLEPAKGATVGRTHLKSTRWANHTLAHAPLY